MKSKQQNVCDLVERLTGIVSMFSVFAFLLKFTPFCRFVLPACYVFDILFVMLLFLRFKLYGFIEYLGSWQNIVDFFAAIPVVVLFARHTELFQFISPAAWFTIFRLLNIIPLIKKDSAFAQRHFKHICFSVILLEVVFILVLTQFFYALFNKPLVEHYTAEYERFPSNPEYLMKNDENVVLVYKNGTIQSRKGFIRDKKTHFAICNSPYEYLIRIKFSKESVVSDGKISAPKCGIIVSSPELLFTFNWLMIAMFLFVCGIFAVILWRDLLSKDGQKIALAANAIKSGDFAKFEEENARIEKSGRDEIALLYQAIDSGRHNFCPKTEAGGGELEEAAEFAVPEEAEELSVLAEAETLEPAEEVESVAEAETAVEAETAGLLEPVEADAPEIRHRLLQDRCRKTPDAGSGKQFQVAADLSPEKKRWKDLFQSGYDFGTARRLFPDAGIWQYLPGKPVPVCPGGHIVSPGENSARLVATGKIHPTAVIADRDPLS